MLSAHCLRFAVIAVGLIYLPAWAQPYPSKSVRIIVPTTAGTASDVVARLLGQSLAQALGQSVVVDNKAGADGAIAATETMLAPPDGYTIIFATNSTHSLVPAMRKSPPYDPLADFTPISYVGRYTHFLLVNPKMPGGTLGEFLAFVRANPGKLNYATGGAFSILSTPQLMKSAGVTMVHVPYKGDPAALVDLVAGRIQFMFVTQTAGVPFVRDGRVRALAVTNSKRSLLAPEVPTLAEAGFPGLLHLSWAGIIGPAKMRPEVVERLNKEFTAILTRPKFQEELIRQGFEPASSSPEELRAFIKEQLEAWTRYVKELGLQTD